MSLGLKQYRKENKIMKQKEQQLLLKDLCGRLPYGVKCLVNFNDGTKHIMILKTGLPNSFGNWDFYSKEYSACSDDFKPYLRPMFSMTEEETEIFNSDFGGIEDGYNSVEIKRIDWLNAHHFDYRNLIEKGLAIAVTKNNNPYEN